MPIIGGGNDLAPPGRDGYDSPLPRRARSSAPAGRDGTPMRISFASLTDLGLVRQNNEDSFLLLDLEAGKRIGPPPPSGSGEMAMARGGLLLAVADGMGGALAGEVASRMAMEVLVEARAKLAAATEEEALRTILFDAIQEANGRIHAASQEEVRHRGMGTTLTAALLRGPRILFFQVGDSRGFIARKGKLHQMTKDHSLIGRLVDDKVISAEDAEQLEGGRNIILQALGAEATVKVDYSDATLGAGDSILLCTDGLHGCVRRQEIEERVATTPDSAQLCQDLVNLARDRGGPDNITVVAVSLEQGEGGGEEPPGGPFKRLWRKIFPAT